MSGRFWWTYDLCRRRSASSTWRCFMGNRLCPFRKFIFLFFDVRNNLFQRVFMVFTQEPRHTLIGFVRISIQKDSMLANFIQQFPQQLLEQPQQLQQLDLAKRKSLMIAVRNSFFDLFQPHIDL